MAGMPVNEPVFTGAAPGHGTDHGKYDTRYERPTAVALVGDAPRAGQFPICDPRVLILRLVRVMCGVDIKPPDTNAHRDHLLGTGSG
jgi:hypothetical protein